MHGTTVRDNPVSLGPKNAGKENVSKDRERTRTVTSEKGLAMNQKDSTQMCEERESRANDILVASRHASHANDLLVFNEFKINP